MTTIAVKRTEELLGEHVQVLRGYAQRVLQEGDALSEVEESDRERRMAQLLAMGSCLKFTESFMVTVIYQDIFKSPRRCGCPTCRNRTANQRQAT